MKAHKILHLFHENYDMQTIYLFIFPSSFLIRKIQPVLLYRFFTSKTAWYLILHACPYRHLSLKTCYFKQEHNTCKMEILSSFQKINIGTQKSSIHSIFPAGSTSLHACLYRHFSLKTACYLNKNTTHANWKFFLVFKK